MAESTNWQASLNEHRSAWIIASCCIATIFLASAWPELFSFEPSPPAAESKQPAHFTTPEKEVSKSIKKQPKQVSKAKKTPPSVIAKKKTVTAKKSRPGPAKTAAKKTTAATGQYFVQAGAFREKTLARKLVAKMKDHGWDAIIVPKSGFHAVWVGPKNSRNGIENLQKSINRTLNIKGFIVQKKTS